MREFPPMTFCLHNENSSETKMYRNTQTPGRSPLALPRCKQQWQQTGQAEQAPGTASGRLQGEPFVHKASLEWCHMVALDGQPSDESLKSQSEAYGLGNRGTGTGLCGSSSAGHDRIGPLFPEAIPSVTHCLLLNNTGQVHGS